MSTTNALASLLALSALGCLDTGQDRVDISLFIAGTDTSTPVTAVGDVEVQIERADLAFGPLYLCAGATAGELCDTARLEWLDTVVVDTTHSHAVEVGKISGQTGTVGSFMYDLGISSQLTRSEPYVLDAAEQLGGVSFVLEGRARIDGTSLRFVVEVPVQQTDSTELGVPVIRKSSQDDFFHEVTGSEAGLLLRFDPVAWVSKIDFRPYAGVPEDEVLVLEEDSEAYRALAVALATRGRPTFVWVEP